MPTSNPIIQLKAKFADLRQELNERQLRLLGAAEAKSLGHGGIKLVAQALGISRRTIERANRSLEAAESVLNGRVRRAGGGRKKLTTTDTSLMEALDKLIDPVTRGDPMSPLRWTSKSTEKLAFELTQRGHPVSATTVARLLHQNGYSLQSMRKKLERTQHQDRDAQFHKINNSVKAFQKRGLPVISIDAKRKELVGNYHDKGKEWQPKGKPEAVQTHDFPDKKLGKVTPYGVLDLANNEGWVSVGIDHDTAEFAVETIRRWWMEMSLVHYPNANKLLITADGGGSNGVRLRLWKKCLQELAQTLGLEIHVRHFPPGTSKWNKIEHRLFSQITSNWRGRALTSRQVVVDLIGATTTKTGLKVRAALDENPYPTKQKVTNAEMESIKIKRARFHGEWNYRILP